MSRPYFDAGRVAAVAAVAALLAGPGHADSVSKNTGAQTVARPAEVTIPNSRRIAFVSKVNGRRYSIDVALPYDPPPPQGYSVLYVLDGYAYFASAAEAAAFNDNASHTVVVGISYPEDSGWVQNALARHRPVPKAMEADLWPYGAALSLEREYDLTLRANPETLAPMRAAGLNMAPEDTGGVDDFLKMIEVDVKPRVQALAPIDRSNQALFGHSLGGSAVVHALFTEPEAYRAFIAASPSIWWEKDRLLADEAAFSAKVASGAVAPKILITVGDGEGGGMIGNACDLVTRLKALHGRAGYEVADCVIFAHQDHGISPWPALGRAISFAFPH